MGDFYESMADGWPALVIISFLLGALVIDLLLQGEIDELGQAICDEEYDMDYLTYWSGELKCQPKKDIAQGSYDGIKIKLTRGDD